MAEQRLPTPAEIAQAVTDIVNAHMKLAFKQYKELKAVYGTPNKAAAEYLKQLTPKDLHSLIDSVNEWVEEQIKRSEEALEKSITEMRPVGMQSLPEVKVPTFSDVQRLVNEHMKLAFQQYKELQKRFGTPTKATAEFLKSVSPKDTHGLIDSVDRWVSEQIALWEQTFERSIELPDTTGAGAAAAKPKRK